MSELKERISRLVAKAELLPPDTLPQADIAARFDPTQYSYTKPVRDALDSFLAQLSRCLPETNELQFEFAPHQIRNDFFNSLYSVEQTIDQTLSLIQKEEGNTVPPRTDPGTFKNFADRISEAEATLFKLFPLFKATTEFTTEQLNQAVERAYTAQQELQKQTTEASRTGEKVAATVLTQENIEELDKAIESHRISARNWLIIFLIACVTMLAVLIFLLYTNPLTTNASVNQLIAYMFGKLLLISFGFGLCIFSGRIYQTHAHNLIQNRQRRIASISFLQLYRAIDAGDQLGRQELIKQAAQAIFAQTSTGFLHKSGNEFTPFAPFITEVLRSGKLSK